MNAYEDRLERLIDDIVRTIDYDIWKDAYNEETAEEPEFVANRRWALKILVYDYDLDMTLIKEKEDANS